MAQQYEYKPERTPMAGDLSSLPPASEVKLKNEDVVNPSSDPEVIKCSAALNEIIGFRGITLEELSGKCGIDVDTLQKYTVTSLDIREAKPLDVMHLADALDVDPAILLGEKSIDEFKAQEGNQGIDPASLAFLRDMMSKPIREVPSSEIISHKK